MHMYMRLRQNTLYCVLFPGNDRKSQQSNGVASVVIGVFQRLFGQQWSCMTEEEDISGFGCTQYFIRSLLIVGLGSFMGFD